MKMALLIGFKMSRTLRATKKPKKTYILGNKDPRGPDNSLTIWIDDIGDLRIQLEKPMVRCFSFSHIEENASTITIVQKR